MRYDDDMTDDDMTDKDITGLFALAATEAAAYRRGMRGRPVKAQGTPEAVLAVFAQPLQDGPTPARDVVAALVAAATPGLVATTGPRYFGFVTGGALPAASAADMLAAAWDQNAFTAVMSPAAAAAEAAAGTWVKDLLGLPATASVGFVTGAQAANTVGLAAARHHVLAQAGWDVERYGLAGAPRVRVLAGVERHATIDRSLRLLGFGTACLEPVMVDRQGAIDVADLERALRPGGASPAIVCLQVGNVNTGAVDDLATAVDVVHAHDSWAHVDGAFGLWAAASPALRHHVTGLAAADSWGCDAHKWLNVPYDSAFAMVSRPDVHTAAVSYSAAYLAGAGSAGSLGDLTVESSRRARGFAVWAALRELGRSGVAGLVERCCALARRFAEQLAAAGFEIGNDVVLNQVLVSFGSDARTDAVVAAVQEDGTLWAGGTTWHGRRWMRISVSNATTTADDVDACVAALTRLAEATRPAAG